MTFECRLLQTDVKHMVQTSYVIQQIKKGDFAGELIFIFISIFFLFLYVLRTFSQLKNGISFIKSYQRIQMLNSKKIKRSYV